MKSSTKIAIGVVVSSVFLKTFLEGSGALPQVAWEAPPPIDWLIPSHAMGETVGVGEDHLPDPIHYLEASNVSAIATSGSPTGTAIGHSNWIVQVGGKTWLF